MSDSTELAPPGTWWLRFGRSASLLVPRRPAALGAALTLACLALAITGIGMGATSYSYADALRVLLGEEAGGAQLVIFEWRLPRILLALSVGAALGVSGNIFQTLTHNPLASPDLIGFTMGSQSGILVAVLLFGGSLATVSLSALLGGLAVGGLIAALSLRGGFGGLRLILAGIAVSSMLGSFNRWLIVRADPDTAFGALKAVTGTLASSDWNVAVPCGLGTLAALVLVLTRSRELRALQLGTDLAQGLGTNVRRAQVTLVILGAALVALATMAAGPIGFVALIAPHIARSLTHRMASGAYTAGAVGALLLLGADLLSQTLLDDLPVGVVTGAVGGLYFMGFLVVEARARKL